MGGLLDQQQGKHPDTDVQTAKEPGRHQTGPGPAQPLFTLVDEPVEGLFTVLLSNVRVRSLTGRSGSGRAHTPRLKSPGQLRAGKHGP